MKKRLVNLTLNLLEEGPMSTAEIHSRLMEKYPKQVPSINRLAMILRGKKGITKFKNSTNQRSSEFGGSISIYVGHTVWTLKEGAC